MGDPFAVRAFVGTFARPMFSWRHAEPQADVQSRRLEASWQGLQADLSTYKLADDINSFVLADPQTSLKEFTPKIMEVDARLDSFLVDFGYGKNTTKQDYLMFFAARGYQCRQLLRQDPSLLQGSIKEQARYLGPHLQLSASARSEISRRCSATRSGFSPWAGPGVWGSRKGGNVASSSGSSRTLYLVGLRVSWSRRRTLLF